MSAPPAKRRLAAISDHLTTPSLVVVLPDGAKVSSHTTSKRGTSEVARLSLDGRPIAEYIVFTDKKYAFDISSVGTPFEGKTEHVPKYELVTLRPANTSNSKRITVEDLWAAIYALFTVYHEHEYIPSSVSAFQNAQELANYLISSGLARKYPGREVNDLYYLNHAAFWQAAGTSGYHSRHWLPNVRPIFPNVFSFTRKDNVVAKHPLRPSKPAPGEVLYRRWISSVGQMLELTYFDLEGVTDGPNNKVDGVSRHLAAFHKWHNDQRVNSAWKEKGSLESHRKYIEAAYADEHTLPCLFSWDGELMGYMEVNYTKEDHVAPYFPADQPPGEWDRGVHVLVGESKFRGNGRSEIWMRSLVHYIFLADPRTLRVVGEPDYNNPAILRVLDKSGYHQPIIFDFPYKRSVLFVHTREKFFKLCRLR